MCLIPPSFRIGSFPFFFLSLVCTPEKRGRRDATTTLVRLYGHSRALFPFPPSPPHTGRDSEIGEDPSPHSFPPTACAQRAARSRDCPSFPSRTDGLTPSSLPFTPHPSWKEGEKNGSTPLLSVSRVFSSPPFARLLWTCANGDQQQQDRPRGFFLQEDGPAFPPVGPRKGTWRLPFLFARAGDVPLSSFFPR